MVLVGRIGSPYHIGMAQEQKKKILIALHDKENLIAVSGAISESVRHHLIYSAADGGIALSKLENDPPHLLITSVELPKVSGIALVEKVIKDRNFGVVSCVIFGSPPESEWCLDEIVTGRIQFIEKDANKKTAVAAILKGLNCSLHKEEAEFSLRLLAPGEQLIREGDKADFIYFVKHGQLKAFKGEDIDANFLGNINAGEFVGEMAFINSEPRVASVVALSSCELIEVPIGTFERVVYQRPSWSKALIQTLSRRVKIAISEKH